MVNKKKVMIKEKYKAPGLLHRFKRGKVGNNWVLKDEHGNETGGFPVDIVEAWAVVAEKQ